MGSWMTEGDLASQCPRVTSCSWVDGDTELMWVKDSPVRCRRTEMMIGYSLIVLAIFPCYLVITTLCVFGVSLGLIALTALCIVVMVVSVYYGLSFLDGSLRIIEFKDVEDVPTP